MLSTAIAATCFGFAVGLATHSTVIGFLTGVGTASFLSAISQIINKKVTMSWIVIKTVKK